MAKVAFPITTFVTPDGNPVALGTVHIRLNVNGSTNNTQLQNNFIKVALDSNGTITGSPTFWPNASILPAGSYYIYSVYNYQGQLLAGPLKVTVTAPSFSLVQISDYASTDLTLASTSWPRSNQSRPVFTWDHSSTSMWWEGGTASVAKGGQYKSVLINGNSISGVTPLPTVQTGFNTNYALIGMDKLGNLYFWSHGIDGFKHIYKTNTSGAALGSIQVPTSDPVWTDANVSFGFVFYNGSTAYLGLLGQDVNGNPGALWIVDTTTMTTVNSIIQLTLNPTAGYNGNKLGMCTDGSGNIFVSVFNIDNNQIELYKSNFTGTVTQYLPFTAGPSTYAYGLMGTQTGNILVFLSDNSVSLLKSPSFGTVFSNVANIGVAGAVRTDIYFNYGLTAPNDTYITVGNWDGSTGNTPISLVSAVDLSTLGSSTSLPPAPTGNSFISYFQEINAIGQVNFDFGYGAEVACYGF